MTPAGSINWGEVVAAIGVALGLASLVGLAWWGLFGDRDRHRRRCPKCWYPMEHSTGMTCPECGHSAANERTLHRRRRSVPIAAAAIIGATALGLWATNWVQVNLWRRLPAWSLLMLLPAADDPNGRITFELKQRIRGRGLSDADWLSLAERCAAGDGGATPPGDEWIAKYGGFVRTVQQRMSRTREGEWIAPAAMHLDSIPLRIDLGTREAWPAGVRAVVEVTVREWWPPGAQLRLRARPALPGAHETVRVLLDERVQEYGCSIELPPLTEGVHHIEIELIVERRGTGMAQWTESLRERRAIDVRIEGDLANHLEPVTDPALDAVMRSVCRLRLAGFSRGSLPVRVRINPQLTFESAFDSTAIGMRVEILRNGRLARQLDAWWIAGAAVAERQYAWEVPFWDDALLAAPDAASDRWTVRARGVPELALRARGGTRYWAGEVEVEVDVERSDGFAPPRGWRFETPRAPDGTER